MSNFKFECDDLKPVEGIARLTAITGASFLYFFAFPITGFFPNIGLKVYNKLADFDPGKAGTMGGGAAKRVSTPAAEKPAAKPAAKPAPKPAEGE